MKAGVSKGYRIRGHVQGVGFRWWTRNQAARLGVAGSVRNCSDGTVEVQARGDPQNLAELERLLRRGPPGAHVSQIDEIPPAVPATPEFRITR
jgi:acylphosphatase